MGQLPDRFLEAISNGDGINVAYEIFSMALVYPNLPFDDITYAQLKEQCIQLMAQVAAGGMINPGFIIVWPIPGGVCRVNFRFSNIGANETLTPLRVRMNAIDGPPEFRNKWANVFTNDWVLVPPASQYQPYVAPPVISGDEGSQPGGTIYVTDGSEAEYEQPDRRTLGQSARALSIKLVGIFAAITFAELVLYRLVPKSVNFPALLVVTMPVVLVILFLNVLRNKVWYDGAALIICFGLTGAAGWQWINKANSPLIFAAALCCSTGIALSWFYDRAPEQRKPSDKLWWGIAGFYLVQLALIFAASR